MRGVLLEAAPFQSTLSSQKRHLTNSSCHCPPLPCSCSLGLSLQASTVDLYPRHLASVYLWLGTVAGLRAAPLVNSDHTDYRFKGTRAPCASLRTTPPTRSAYMSSNLHYNLQERCKVDCTSMVDARNVKSWSIEGRSIVDRGSCAAGTARLKGEPGLVPKTVLGP